MRTQKVEYESQLRTKNTLIRELEEKLSSFQTSGTTTSLLKPDDSRITGTPYGTTSSSNIDRMTSSVASSSSSLSGAGLTSSQYGSTTQSGVRYTGSSYQPAQYGTTGITSTYGVGSSSGLSGSGVTSGITTNSYGTTGQTTTTYGTSGTTGQTTSTYGTGSLTGSGSGSGSGSGYRSPTSADQSGVSGYQSYFSKYARGGNWAHFIKWKNSKFMSDTFICKFLS